MIRIHKSVLVEGSPAMGNSVCYIEGACVSDDLNDLPTEGIAMGSKMYIVDDKEEKVFNEETESWS